MVACVCTLTWHKESLIWTPVPFLGALPLWPNYVPKTPPLNSVTVGSRIWRWERGTQTDHSRGFDWGCWLHLAQSRVCPAPHPSAVNLGWVHGWHGSLGDSVHRQRKQGKSRVWENSAAHKAVGSHGTSFRGWDGSQDLRGWVWGQTWRTFSGRLRVCQATCDGVGGEGFYGVTKLEATLKVEFSVLPQPLRPPQRGFVSCAELSLFSFPSPWECQAALLKDELIPQQELLSCLWNQCLVLLLLKVSNWACTQVGKPGPRLIRYFHGINGT